MMDTVAMKVFHMMENREDAAIIWTKIKKKGITGSNNGKEDNA